MIGEGIVTTETEIGGVVATSQAMHQKLEEAQNDSPLENLPYSSQGISV